MPNMIKCALQFDNMIKNKWNLQAVKVEIKWINNNNNNYKVHNKYLTN